MVKHPKHLIVAVLAAATSCSEPIPNDATPGKPSRLQERLEGLDGVRKELDPESLALIAAAGEGRDVSAVPTLCDFIDYCHPGWGPLLEPPEEIPQSHPAVGALQQIGSPALPEVEARLGSERNPKRRYLFNLVRRHIRDRD